MSNMSPTNKYRANMSQTAYSAYIKNNMGMPSLAISDHEHVTFLLYWLNSIVFCSKSVKAQTTLLPLAALIHEGKNYACQSYFWLDFIKKPATLSNILKKEKFSIQVALFGSSNSGSMPSSSYCSSIELLPFCTEILRVHVSAIFVMRNVRT